MFTSKVLEKLGSQDSVITDFRLALIPLYGFISLDFVVFDFLPASNLPYDLISRGFVVLNSFIRLFLLSALFVSLFHGRLLIVPASNLLCALLFDLVFRYIALYTICCSLLTCLKTRILAIPVSPIFVLASNLF